MKEFIDKLINELEKLGEHCLYMNNWQGQTAICDAIEIVNQLAEEYKVSEMPTGWIPCSGCKDCQHKECEHYGEI